MTSILSLIKAEIINQKSTDVDLKLSLLPVMLPNAQYERVLFILISCCHDVGNSPALITILTHYTIRRSDIDLLPCLPLLASIPQISDTLLLFCYNAYDGKQTQLDIYTSILATYNNPILRFQLLKKWYRLLPTMTIDEWVVFTQQVNDMTEEDETDMTPVKDWAMAEFYIIKSNVIPDWMIQNTEKLSIPIVPRNILPSVPEAVVSILENLKRSGIVYSSLEEDIVVKSLTLQYSISSIEEKLFLLKSDKKFDDTLLFQHYGPINSLDIHSDIYDTTNKCNDGCRMYTCNCFCTDIYEDVNDESQDEHTRDWFTGECEYCGCIIKNRKYALRKPLIGGGFYGCYCPMQCLKLDIDDNVNELLIVGRMIEQLNRTGVFYE